MNLIPDLRHISESETLDSILEGGILDLILDKDMTEIRVYIESQIIDFF